MVPCVCCPLFVNFIQGKAWEWIHPKVGVARETTQTAILCGIITEIADGYKYLSNAYLFFFFRNLTLHQVAVCPLGDHSVFQGTQTKVVRKWMTTRNAS